ncbi:MAG TPA: hypothetical protein PKD48_01920 [Sphingopyxis sp.]|nr:hypothetical protein [Sphingopyxis sp.]
MIAVCLLTADRADYTLRTLESFSAHNNGHLLLHADDASSDDRNMQIAARFGFETVYRSANRQGGCATARMAWQEAVRRGATRILHLENDWEWVAPIPDVEAPCVRLTGLRKSRAGPREYCDPRNLASGKVVDWTPDVEGWERGVTHWGGPPSITDAGKLLAASNGVRLLSDMKRRMEIETLRPNENICWHIGERRTEGTA